MTKIKLTKMEQIRLTLAMIPYYILGVFKGVWLFIKAYIKSFLIMHHAQKTGAAVCYTGVKEGLINFHKTFLIQQKPMVLHTDQGDLLLIHGSPSKKLPFVVGGLPIDEKTALMLGEIKAGDYILVSCHNQYHDDIDWNGVKAVKEQNTITPYPILASLNPLTHKLWLTSNKEVGQMYADMQGISLSLMEDGFDTTIWQNVESSIKILSEDEVPDSVKKQIKNNHA